MGLSTNWHFTWACILITASYCCNSCLGSFFILYPFTFCVLKCGGLCTKTFYNAPWRAMESECWTSVLKDLNPLLEWSSLFLVKETFILTEGTSQKATREIYCLEVTKNSVVDIRAALLALCSGRVWRKGLTGSPSQFCAEFGQTRLLNHAWAVPDGVPISFKVWETMQLVLVDNLLSLLGTLLGRVV